jgi:predicted transcriptional regulator
MSPRRKAPPERLLTGVELELMTIVWELGGGTVQEVLDRLPPERPLAYTSVATMLRILEQKGVLQSERQGRGFRYEPILRKSDYQAVALDHVVGKVFGGEPVELVRRLVDEGLSKTDVEELRRLLGKATR